MTEAIVRTTAEVLQEYLPQFVRVFLQFLRRPLINDLAQFEAVDAMAYLQHFTDFLFHDQEGYAVVTVESLDAFESIFYQGQRKPQ